MGDLFGRFEKLCHPLETDRSDRGQLLLVVFAGLFSRIESDFKTFVNAVTSLQLPETWKMVDMVLQAQAIQVRSRCSFVHFLIYLFQSIDDSFICYVL